MLSARHGLLSLGTSRHGAPHDGVRVRPVWAKRPSKPLPPGRPLRRAARLPDFTCTSPSPTSQTASTTTAAVLNLGVREGGGGRRACAIGVAAGGGTFEGSAVRGLRQRRGAANAVVGGACLVPREDQFLPQRRDGVYPCPRTGQAVMATSEEFCEEFLKSAARPRWVRGRVRAAGAPQEQGDGIFPGPRRLLCAPAGGRAGDAEPARPACALLEQLAKTPFRRRVVLRACPAVPRQRNTAGQASSGTRRAPSW